MLESSIVDSLKAALQTWDRPDVSKDAQEAEVLRAEFVARFPLTSWPNMSVDSYALGLSTDGGTVCWWLE